MLVIQLGLRAITTSVSPGQSQKMPSAERSASSARTSLPAAADLGRHRTTVDPAHGHDSSIDLNPHRERQVRALRGSADALGQ